MEAIVKSQACSILLPLYNGAYFIEDAITSNLESMRDIDELLIVNDGSQDISKEALKKFESRDSRIRIINKSHTGLVETLNHGITHCENELIARADMDDKYSPMRILKQVNHMTSNPNCAAVFSDYQLQTIDGNDLGVIPTAISPILTKFSLFNPQRTPHPSVMFRKSAVKDVGFYNSSDFPAEDLSLWVQLSKYFEISTIPETLLYYTVHKANITSKHQLEMVRKTKALVEKLSTDISFEQVLNDAKESFKVYDSSSKSLERKLLFFRDLDKFLRLSQNRRFDHLTQQVLLFGKVVRPSIVPKLIQLRKMQYRRKISKL